MNLNQIFAITLVVLGVLAASTAQLNDLVGPTATKTIVSIAGLLTSIISGILGVLTGQASQVKAVQAMPGVEKIVVNKEANQTLAALAIDPLQDKVEALPTDESAVTKTAKG